MEVTFPIRFGKYVLLERISAGGMSEVFRAKATGAEGFSRMVALKRILPHYVAEKSFVTMFIDEAKISAALHHPNICQIIDFGRVGDSYFLSMEHVAGQSLRALQRRFLSQRKLIPQAVVLHLIANLCDALDYAHGLKDAQGKALSIVHRDIKPQNLLISYQGELKLIDFGIAKAAYRLTHTQNVGVKGTWCYMAPEQIRNRPVDHRSDVFAVGLILHELLTGRRVYPKGSDPGILELVRNAEIRRPSEIRASIPARLDAIVMRALARDPMDRYATAGEMRSAVAGYAETTGRPSTRHELGSLMQQVFAEEQRREIERAGQLASLQVTEETELEEIRDVDLLPPPEEPSSPGSGSEPSVNSAAGHLTTDSYSVAEPGPAPLPPLELLIQPPPPRSQKRSRLWIPLLAAGVLLVGGLTIAIVMLLPEPQRGEPVRPQAVTPVPAELRIVSIPAGARVELYQGKIRLALPAPDATPLTLRDLRPGERYLVRLLLDGHIPVERELRWGEAGAELSFQLTPLPRVAAAPPGPVPSPSPTPSPAPNPAPVPAAKGKRRVVKAGKRGIQVAVTEPAPPSPAPAPAPPEPAPAPPQPRPAPKPVARPTPTPKPAPTPAPAPKPAAPTSGGLIVRSDVPGFVFIDGKNTGQTTPARFELSLGAHEVVVVLKKSNVQIRHSVTIKPGKTIALRFKENL